MAELFAWIGAIAGIATCIGLVIHIYDKTRKKQSAHLRFDYIYAPREDTIPPNHAGLFVTNDGNQDAIIVEYRIKGKLIENYHEQKAILETEAIYKHDQIVDKTFKLGLGGFEKGDRIKPGECYSIIGLKRKDGNDETMNDILNMIESIDFQIKYYDTNDDIKSVKFGPGN